MKATVWSWFAILSLTIVLIGCGGDDGNNGSTDTSGDPFADWFSSPGKVVEGIMHAYTTRNDSLYAALLADEFRYYFEPEGADSAEVLGWGKEEEVVATGNLFRTAEVERLDYSLDTGKAQPVPGRDGWMMVPVAGGEMVVTVRDKDAMQVVLNRQEIVLRPVDDPVRKWQVVEWHDYPVSEPPDGE